MRMSVMHVKQFSVRFVLVSLLVFMIARRSLKSNSNSVRIQNKTEIKMKILGTGRQILSWFCTDAIDGPLTKHQMLLRKNFRLVFKVISTAVYAASNLSLLRNLCSGNDIDEIFFGFYQFNITSHGASAVVVIYAISSKLSSLFRNLEDIYNACKDLTDLKQIVQNCFQIILRLKLIPDPDERLTKTDETCEHFYRGFMKFLTKWSIAGFFLVSIASVVICQLKHGIGHIYTAELFHPIRLM